MGNAFLRGASEARKFPGDYPAQAGTADHRLEEDGDGKWGESLRPENILFFIPTVSEFR